MTPSVSTRIPAARFAALTLMTAALLVPVAASAQVIPIKTVPVATGDQFLVFPSDRLGMGGVTIAVDDTLGDPFSNPATLLRLERIRLFGSPTAYGITGGNGSALTLPVGALFGSSAWRGGAGFALQELDRGPRSLLVNPTLDGAPRLLSRSKTNLYGFGAVARSLGESETSEIRAAVGASVALASLNAVEGVDLLYDRETLGQDGGVLELRAGLTAAWGDEEVLEAVVVHQRIDLEYDVQEWLWFPVEDPALPPEQWSWQTESVRRTDEDRTRGWGLQLVYNRPLADDGWRLGALLTANHKTHPKIPNYSLMSIPRDPGDTWAYDVGIGVSGRTRTSVVALDLVYEPIWTETWADAAAPVTTVGGRVIPVGDMTVYNDFKFDNVIMRMGVAGATERLDLQFGLDVKGYRYSLEQTDFVLERKRRQREDWLEWTPTLGLGVRFDDFSIGYTGRLTLGTGRPGVDAWGGGVMLADASMAGIDYIPAPSAALTLVDAVVHTHQVAVEIPIGGR